MEADVCGCSFQTDIACIGAKGTIVWMGMASGLVEPFPPHITGLKAVKFMFASYVVSHRLLSTLLTSPHVVFS